MIRRRRVGSLARMERQKKGSLVVVGFGRKRGRSLFALGRRTSGSLNIQRLRRGREGAWL